MVKDTWLLGVDGGGSGTQAILANTRSGQRFYAETGATNANNLSENVVQQRLETLVSSITCQAGIGVHDIGGTCFSGAGIDTAEDEVRMGKWLKDIGLSGEILVCNDAYAALVGGNSGRKGAIIICGTGSIALGVHGHEQIRVGGWGNLISDEGSGWYLGTEAIRQVLRAYDGRGPKTVLTEYLAEVHQLRTPEDMMTCLYRNGGGKERIASLATSVLAAAESGDCVAKEIVCRGIAGLVDLTDALVSRIGNDTFPLCYGGSVLVKSTYYRTRFESAAHQKYPSLNCHLPDAGPLEGALRMLEAYHVEKGC